MEKLKTGVPHLDTLLDGGFTPGDAILVKGGPGAGKTVLGVQWICRGAADFGEPGAIVVLEETPQQFYRRARAFGWDLRELEEQNKVRVIFTSAEALSRDILTGSLLVGLLAEIEAKRVVIDPISHYRLIYPDGQQLRQQIYTTINALKRLGQTSLLTAEVGTAGWTDPSMEEYLADTVISLGSGPIKDCSFRRLTILKSSTYDQFPRSALFRIAPVGIQLAPPLPTGLSRLSQVLPSGIMALHEDLGANYPAGGFCLFQVETNLQRTLLDVAILTLGGIHAETLVYLASSCVSPRELWNTVRAGDPGQSAVDPLLRKQVHLLEPFGRQQPTDFPSSGFHRLAGCNDLASLPGDEKGQDGLPSSWKGKVLFSCDISDLFYHLGSERFRAVMPPLVDTLKSRQAMLVGVVNPQIMSRESCAWVQSMADGIIRIYEAEGCRFVQVVKSPGQGRSEPRLLVETSDPPFFEVF